MLILEATMAVVIITGVLIAVYSQQTHREVDVVDYYDNLQSQILDDVSSSRDLRLNVLNVVNETLSDSNFSALDDFIRSKIPDGFGYHIRVCNFSELVCKMENSVFIATMDKDIYVEEIIVSAEIGEGTNAIYSPKRLKLFVWEGEIVGAGCDLCSPEGYKNLDCSGGNVFVKTCGDFNGDGCLEYNGSTLFEDCVSQSKVCVGGACVSSSGFFNLTCERTVLMRKDCRRSFNMETECGSYDIGIAVECCEELFCYKSKGYECYNIETNVTGCLEAPQCLSGWTENERNSCIPTGCTPNCVGKKCGDDGCGGNCPPGCETDEDCVYGLCVGRTANLVASYVINSIRIDGEDTYYDYTSTISETNGVGVTINSRQKCYNVAGCDSVKYNIADDYGTNYITPNGQISDPANYWYTSYSSERMIETFWGTDDNGNPVSASYSMNHPS